MWKEVKYIAVSINPIAFPSFSFLKESWNPLCVNPLNKTSDSTYNKTQLTIDCLLKILYNKPW